MKHIHMSSHWKWSIDPFPAYRCDLVFGRTKKCHKTLPVQGVLPRGQELLLPTDGFQVVKSIEDGTIKIVSGVDTTDRVLLFSGCPGGFRGDVWLDKEQTTGNVLLHAFAGSACESQCSTAALLLPGQQVVYRYTGRYGSGARVYRHEGGISERTYRGSEYDMLVRASKSMEQVEVL